MSQPEPLVDLGPEPCYRDGLGDICLVGHLSRLNHSPNAAQLKPCVLFNFYNLYLFIYLFLAGLGLNCCLGFSLVAASRGYSSYGTWASHCRGFSFCGAQGLGCVSFSSCSPRALEHRLNSCGTWA